MVLTSVTDLRLGLPLPSEQPTCVLRLSLVRNWTLAKREEKQS